MYQKTNHSIKHRKISKNQTALIGSIPNKFKINDEFYTPPALIIKLLEITPLTAGDTLLDSAYGTGNFYNNFPQKTSNSYSEDFFNVNNKFDWIITNPPYSVLDKWIEHTCKLSIKGFGLLISLNNITPKRLEIIENAGFGLTYIEIFKVHKWFGESAYIILEKNKKSIFNYNRTVWY